MMPASQHLRSVAWAAVALLSALVATWWLLGDQSEAPEKNLDDNSPFGESVDWPIGVPCTATAVAALVRAAVMARSLGQLRSALPVAAGLAVGALYGWIGRLATARVSGANFALGEAYLAVPVGVAVLVAALVASRTP